MKLPRYRVTSIEGWHGNKKTATWYVVDSAFCFRIVRRYVDNGWWMTSPRFEAELACRKLNHDWLKAQWPDQ